MTLEEKDIRLQVESEALPELLSVAAAQATEPKEQRNSSDLHMPSLASQVSKAVVWNTLFAPVRLIADAVATFLKLTVLAPASYGVLSILTSYNNGLGTVIDLGTGRALPKYIPETVRAGGPLAMRRLLLIVFGAQLAVFALIALGLTLFNDWYADSLRSKIISPDVVIDTGTRNQLLSYVDQNGWLLIGLILLLLLIGIVYDVFMAYLSSFFKQRAWNSIDIAAQLLPKLLTVGVILAGWGLPGLLLVMVLAPAVVTGLLVWSVLRHQREINALPQPEYDGPLIPPGFVRYCGVSLLMNGSDFIASGSFIIFFTRNVVDAAVLAAGVNIVRMVLAYLYTPMVGVQVPLFTRVRFGEGGTLQGAYQSLIRLQVLLLVPGGLGLMVLAQPLFTILFPQYTQAAPLVWVLVPCFFIESLLTTAHNALIVYERLRSILIARVLSLIAVFLMLSLAPYFDIVGAVLSFGLARIAAGLWVTGSGYRLLGLRWPWRFTLRVVAASAAMALVVVGLSALLPIIPSDADRLNRLMMIPLLFSVAVIGAVVFLCALRLTGGLDPRDREQIAAMKLPFKRWLNRIV